MKNLYPHIKGKFGSNKGVRINQKGTGLEYVEESDYIDEFVLNYLKDSYKSVEEILNDPKVDIKIKKHIKRIVGVKNE